MYDSLIESQITEDFEIEQRVASSDLHLLDSNFSRLGEFVKTLLEYVEIDLIFDNSPDNCVNHKKDSVNETDNDYIQLSECNLNEIEIDTILDDKIITTEVTRIEGAPHIEHLLHTPPGTSHSIETSTKNRIFYDRKVKNLHKKNKTEKILDKSLTNTKLNQGLHSWYLWIEKLVQNDICEIIPFSLENTEQCNDNPNEKVDLDKTSKKILQCRNSVLTFMNMLLKNRVLNPEVIRLNLCDELRNTDELPLEKKINNLFDFLNTNLFFNLLNDVKIEWSYRLKSTAACTILEREPSPPHIVIRLSWNLLTRLQIIEIAKMLLHEMIHAFLGLANGDFCEKHDSNFENILKKINFILKLNIPIEHDYEETMELAYVWKCTKCFKKRIRFYNIPPTKLQKEQHGIKCDGKFVKSVSPRIFKHKL